MDGVPVAIVGLSFRFGGEASSTDGFWDMITAGRCSRAPVPQSRFNADAFYHPDTNRLEALPVNQGNFITEDIAAFDAPFFSIRAAEAAAMDPQSRKLLEATYRALENAGIPIERCAGTKTCVFTGVSSDDYRLMYNKDTSHPIRHAATGMAMSMLANKISWFYDFKGPSVQLDTACSASLNALHLACRSIRSGESEMGIVGGANLFFAPQSMSPLAHLNFFSPDATCHSFDARANGYCRGEGFGVLVLKPLAKALADGDPIRAVIRATGSNENGRSVGGITKVSFDAQQSLVASTYRSANLDPSLTRYVEAHAPGTEGDQVETRALASIFKDHRSPDDPLYMGSVKANLGHLEGTSGIASLVKVVMMLERSIIPKIANFETLHPNISGTEWNMAFPKETIQWPEGVRRASINSFGFGGANAHVVIEDGDHHVLAATALKPRPSGEDALVNGASDGVDNERCNGTNGVVVNGVGKTDSMLLLVWSAADEQGLERMRVEYSSYLEKNTATDMRKLAFTLSARRTQLPWKSFMVARDKPSSLELSKPIRSIKDPKLAFVFTGQGVQWANMGTQFLGNPCFRQSLSRLEEYFKELGASWDLEEELSKSADESRLDSAEFSQPICTAIQIAMVDLLRSYGVRPSLVVGHSSGEIAAAYASGAISARSACRVAFYRGKVISEHFSTLDEDFGMLVVGLPVSEVESILEHNMETLGLSRVAIACINSPKNVTLSGPLRPLKALKSLLEVDGTFLRILAVPAPYHSPILNDVADMYASLLNDLEPGSQGAESPQMVSSVTTKLIDRDTPRQGSYWVNNLVSTVKFEPAIATLLQQQPLHALVEVGPTGALRSAIRDTMSTIPTTPSSMYFNIMDKKNVSLDRIFDTLGHLHSIGFPIDLEVVNRISDNDKECLIDLPEYPFDHSKTYWHESQVSRDHRFQKHARNDLLGSRILNWNPLAPRWRNMIRTLENPWIEDHKIAGALIYPGAGMIVMAIEAAAQYVSDIDTRRPAGFLLKDVTFVSALNIASPEVGASTEIGLIPIDPNTSNSANSRQFSFQITLLDGEQWREVCTGKITIKMTHESSSKHMKAENKLLEERRRQQTLDQLGACRAEIRRQKLYGRFRETGLEFGPTFQVFDDVKYDWRGGLASARIRLDNWKLKGKPEHATPHFIHPTALDGVLQLPVVSLGAGVGQPVPTMVPSQLETLWIDADILSHAVSSKHVQAVSKADYLGFRNTKSEISVLSMEDSHVVLFAEGLETIIIGGEAVSDEEKKGQPFYNMSWKLDIEGMSPGELQKYCTSNLPTTPASKAHNPLSKFMSLVLHHNVNTRMLEVAPEECEDISHFPLWNLLKDFEGPAGYYDLATRNRIKDRPIEDTVKEGSMNESTILDLEDLFQPGLDAMPKPRYDLIFTPWNGQDLDKHLSDLAPLVRARGRIIFLAASTPNIINLQAIDGSFEKELELEWDGKLLTSYKPVAVTPPVVEERPISVILAPNPSFRASNLAKAVFESFINNGYTRTKFQLWDEAQVAPCNDEHTIFISGFNSDRPFDTGLGIFSALKLLCSTRNSILWVSSESDCSSDAIAAGLTRSVRNERPDINLTTLTLDIPALGADQPRSNALGAIMRVFRKHTTPFETKETEYSWPSDGDTNSLLTPRLSFSPAISSYVNEKSHKQKIVQRKFICPGAENIKLTITTPGLLETLTFVPDPTAQTAPQSNEVLIQPAYTGLNFLDVLTALGRIPQISVLGVEAAGTVTAVGTSADLRVGDRVVVLTDGTVRSCVRADYRTAVKIPDGLSMRDAASMPGTACTVYRALVDVAGLQPDEKVLIHAGAGATGQMAIQLAQHIGAEVFVTVGSDAKRQLIATTYGIPDNHIFHTRDVSFVTGMKRVTNGYGVDVVLNSLSGELLEAGWTELMAPFGRWVELGKKDILDNRGLSMRPLLNNISFSCVDLSGIWRHKPALMRRLLNDVFRLVSEGAIEPVAPLTEFGVGKVETAFRSLQSGRIGGKVVINMDEEEEVTVKFQPEKTWAFKPNRSYLLVGGFGGISRSVARWMVKRGARNLILLSRTGANVHPNRLALIEELRGSGCMVEVLVCDVSDHRSLEIRLQSCQQKLGPIAGCIQSSMVLKDQYFKNMSEEEWRVSTTSKIAGSWNLDRLLPNGLDFFIFFSSLVGVVGGEGQGNYSAGNAFQDSLALSRVRRGQKAVSFDLGMVVGEGAVAEDEHLARTLESFGWYEPTTMRELGMLLERYCDPELPLLKPEEAQVVLGIRSPAALQAGGYAIPKWMAHPMFKTMYHETRGTKATSGSDTAQQDRNSFKTSKSLHEAGAIVVQALTKKLSHALGIPISDVDASRAVHLYGVDSLIALELKNWFTNEYKADITVLQILSNITLEQLGLKVAEESSFTKALNV
ncbi:unnamed protein product [Clonostachys rhizophaga]|uniref:Uncharacterized protein n=1 Tax=Clonostachys rhizophaga TaxID=160324 RepID=A0A9N9V0X1_9HYPO|nr:unnamed protein product [Clonostachys rhizophaga]